MPKRSSKKPARDVNVLAASIVEAATGQQENQEAVPEITEEAKHAAAVALGRLGGKKGGPARAKRLTTNERSEIARRAAKARWERKR